VSTVAFGIVDASSEKLPPLKTGGVSQQAVEYRGAIYKAEVGPEVVAVIKDRRTER